MDAYIFFDKRRGPISAPWHLVCNRNWSHCLAVLDDGDKSIVCEQLAGGLAILKGSSIQEEIDHWKKFDGTAIVKYPMPKDFGTRFRWRGIMTCVSIVKAILRIENPFIVSPKGLFQYLVKNGGTIIFKKDC